ncbi:MULTISPECIES: hypothetical protein [Crateriforma]|uniref:Uncharacterized protein n=1 Tax=Crateriforma conspicua TaxID=2527996 RepID=A0A5C5YH12_9PLAN|nr:MULTISPECIES: hypothetical protein [Crateriforma]TWT72532.1 hypothetical protein Pan14r_48520 [Crateriforma conspicua]
MGCDSGCDSCGCSKKSCGGLLTKLFGNLKKKSSCCDSGCDMGCDTGCSSCGCGAPMAAPMAAPAPSAAPMPPAPVVDPSASISRTRRVIQASASYAR